MQYYGIKHTSKDGTILYYGVNFRTFLGERNLGKYPDEIIEGTTYKVAVLDENLIKSYGYTTKEEAEKVLLSDDKIKDKNEYEVVELTTDLKNRFILR